MNDNTGCFWGSKIQDEGRWSLSGCRPLWEPVRVGGTLSPEEEEEWPNATWSLFSIRCARQHLPLFDSRFPASQSNLLHQLSHSTSIDATDSDLYPGQCVHPPSPCINIDRLTRSHQRPYRCFLPAPALDAPTSDQFLHHHKLEPPTLYGPRLANWGKWATSCSALVVFSTWIGDKQTWGGQKPLIKRSVPSKQWGR